MLIELLFRQLPDRFVYRKLYAFASTAGPDQCSRQEDPPFLANGELAQAHGFRNNKRFKLQKQRPLGSIVGVTVDELR